MLDAILSSPRERLVSDLDGRLLEVGCGDGSTFQFYRAAAIVAALEPSLDSLAEALRAAQAARAHIKVQAGAAEELPFASGTFDGYVSSLVFCSVRSQEQALAEARRVLKPGSPARFLEHIRSEGRVAAWLQDAANPAWRALNGEGCNLNRRTVEIVARAGFAVRAVRPVHIPWPFRVIVPVVEIYAEAT